VEQRKARQQTASGFISVFRFMFSPSFFVSCLQRLDTGFLARWAMVYRFALFAARRVCYAVSGVRAGVCHIAEIPDIIATNIVFFPDIKQAVLQLPRDSIFIHGRNQVFHIFLDFHFFPLCVPLMKKNRKIHNYGLHNMPLIDGIIFHGNFLLKIYNF